MSRTSRKNVSGRELHGMLLARGQALTDALEREKHETHRDITTAFRYAVYKQYDSTNRAVAAFLGVSVHDLWPEWYDREGYRIHACGCRLVRQPKSAPPLHALPKNESPPPVSALREGGLLKIQASEFCGIKGFFMRFFARLKGSLTHV